VTTSCTISIDSTIMRGARRCTVDGGIWSGCNVSHPQAQLTAGWSHSGRLCTRDTRGVGTSLIIPSLLSPFAQIWTAPSVFCWPSPSLLSISPSDQTAG
jgi:hypothetical protein